MGAVTEFNGQQEIYRLEANCPLIASWLGGGVMGWLVGRLVGQATS